jgi:hypothetical protein
MKNHGRFPGPVPRPIRPVSHIRGGREGDPFYVS